MERATFLEDGTGLAKAMPLFNNTFLADGVRARWALPTLLGGNVPGNAPNTCQSGIMINFYPTSGFECEPGQWRSPSPYTSALATFTALQH